VAGRDEIIDFCDALLDADSFEDYGPNGRQVPGADQVSKVATGVSANLETIRRAVGSGAQLILTHHGLFWGELHSGLTPQLTERIRALLEGNATLAAYHLPLDAHPEIGNNALLCEHLGFERGPMLGEAKGRAIGFAGSSPGVSIEDLVASITELLGREPLVQGDGPPEVKTIGVVSGGGTPYLEEAVELGLDAFLTGEPAERAMADAAEAGIHFIAAGHYATETLGIRRLGELVGERFGVEHEFVDVPNPV
jgi:dinuclear metal center YbgI/SA1388 family protein